MNKPLLSAAVAVWTLLLLAACTGTKTVRLYDPDRIGPGDAACIDVPLDIAVLKVDGKNVDGLTDFLAGSTKRICLDPGEHRFNVRYNDLWDIDDNNFEKFRSNEIFLMFNARTGGVYRLVHPEISDIREAAAFEKDPDIWIEEPATGNRVSVLSADETATTADTAAAEAGVSEPDDSSLEKDWDSMSKREKEAFKKWMETRDRK